MTILGRAGVPVESRTGLLGDFFFRNDLGNLDGE
jgi:hypothetical protein